MSANSETVQWVLVDTEHGNIDDSAMHEAVAAIAACGVSPIVRIAANEGWMVKRSCPQVSKREKSMS
jgi:4-hydroxy-2-oxoheptanedioate aldolase